MLFCFVLCDERLTLDLLVRCPLIDLYCCLLYYCGTVILCLIDEICVSSVSSCRYGNGACMCERSCEVGSVCVVSDVVLCVVSVGDVLVG